jgi:uncharacterized repeat protein (TIGR03943 family)
MVMKKSLSFQSLRDATLLLLWGGAILTLAHTASLSTYLHPSLQPYAVASGYCLLILAAFTIRSLVVTRPHHHHDECCRHDDHEGEGHCHGESHHHGHGDQGLPALFFKTLVLLVPIIMIASGSGDRFTTSTVRNRGIVGELQKLPSAKPAMGSVTSIPGTPATSSTAMPVQIIDLLYALQMPSYREEFEGKQIELTGQYVPLTTGNAKGDRFQLIRLFMTCCAADAKPVGVTVRYPANEAGLGIPEMGWVKVTGRPTFPMEGGRHTAVIEASKVEPCEAPSEPFVY